jgi:protein-disulfide isomerase
LTGVDTAELTSRELGLWWRVVNESLAPCPQEPVSIAQCIDQARPCAACAPAASFLAGRVARGDSLRAIESAYAARFTAEARPIEVGDSPARGPIKAPVTIVVWSDFQCPSCRRGVPALDAAYEANPGAVRLVHKFYPLKVHPRAEDAARAAIAAADQGKYWELERSLFEHQAALEPQDIERYASDLGLDLARFRADLASARTTAWLARDRAAADALGLDGTPFIFVNGRPFDLRLFSLDEDLSAWIRLEIAMSAPPPARN